MTLIEQVNNMNIDDLRMLNKLAVSRINDISANYRFNFKAGDKVIIRGGRGNIAGTVVKIMRKNVQVKADNGFVTYNVTPTLLKHVGEK
jgi:sRNA-binding protein